MGTETVAAPGLNSRSSDDEILGLTTHVPRKNAHRGVDAASRDLAAGRNEQLDLELGGSDGVRDDGGTRGEAREESRSVIDAARRAAENLTPEDVPPNLREVFEANPELRDAWRDVNEYRETFATPEEARSATALLGDLNRMDSLFYSRRPEDHAELARAVAKLDPTAFASLAREMANLATSATQRSGEGTRQVRRIAEGDERATSRNPVGGFEPQEVRQDVTSNQDGRPDARPETRQEAAAQGGLTPAQTEFFHATNAAAVQSVLNAIETQVERLLPEGIAKSARNRVVGEIYREIDATLRGNRALGRQMREAFRSGALDEDHRRAIVSLVTGRARQAFPAVAKRVLDEWTTTVVSANHARRARQRTAERRVDIAGSGGAGNDGRRAASPRDIDYARMSDADILNL
ncbi:MAG: hypothetical protein WB680_12820 [Candidatus Acidiferrales bacterium]